MGLSPCQEESKGSRKLVPVLAATLSCSLLILVLLIAVLCYLHGLQNKGKSLGKSRLTALQLSSHEDRTFTLRELEIATAGFGEENLLGRGSFGSVYKAVVRDGTITLAVKVLNGDCVQSQKSFKRECQILSTVRHRNLVKMVGSLWSPQFKALVLEFIGNGNLAQHLYSIGSEEGRECKLSLRERISVLEDIANGLEYLHERCSVQIIHCDLKPQNVLIDSEMVAHVADFGVGKLVEEDRTRGVNSTTNFLRGTFGYMPPEYGQGIVTTRGDVYSFGVVLLETMTRKSPTSKELSDGLNLRNWVSSLYPYCVWEAIDKSLKEEAASGSAADSYMSRYKSCCADVIKVGMICTEENLQKRPLMSSVVRLLEDAWNVMGFDKPITDDCKVAKSNAGILCS